MPKVIEITKLTRQYKSYKKSEGLWNSIKGLVHREYITKEALKPTTLEIDANQIVGLVGANGAGKTTLLKLLSGLIYPSGGDALILGFRPWDRDPNYLRRMSVLLGQKNQLWWDIPPMDSYELLAKIYGVPLVDAKKRVKELSEMLQCEAMLRVQLRRLSLGERMKMEIIGALLHYPEVLFLDEPTIGLDVVAQNSIRQFISKYVKEFGPTVILTSHYMDDIARLANRLLLISHGTIVYDGTVKGFVSQAQTRQKLFIRFVDPVGADLQFETFKVSAGQQSVEFEIESSKLPEVVASLIKAAPVQEMKIEEANFEDVIRKYLEQESRVL